MHLDETTLESLPPAPDELVGLHHLALGARDVARLAEFYRRGLGLKVARRNEDAAGLRSVWFLLGGGGVLMLERCGAEVPLPVLDAEGHGAGLFLFCVRVRPESRVSAELRVLRAGGTLLSSGEFTTYFLDPEGNRVALSVHPLLADMAET